MGSKEKIILKRIIELVSRKAPDSEVFLFGSRARSEARRRSDWDILILLNKKSVSSYDEIQLIDDFYDLEIETGAVISPLIYSKAEWQNNHSITPLFENIQKEGVRIK